MSYLFDIARFTPHGFCLLWDPGLIWLHVGGDALIGLAYYSISLALISFVRQRTDIAFGWIYWLFAAFILACGTTHFLSIVTLWQPFYWLEGMAKAITAVISVSTAIALWPLIPRALAVPSVAALRELNAQLQRRIAERDEMESRYHGLLEAYPDAMVVSGPGGEIILLNAQAEKQFGYRRDELLGQRVTIIIPLGLPGYGLAGEPPAGGPGPAVPNEAPQMRQMGEEVALVGHWRVYGATRQLYWSEEVYRIHGLSADSGQPSLATAINFYHPDDLPVVTAVVENALETGIGFNCEFRIVRTDGVIRNVVCWGQAERGADGAIGGIFGVFHDVTERHEAERERARLNERLRLATQAGAVGIWEWLIPEHEFVGDEGMRQLYRLECDEPKTSLADWSRPVHADDIARVNAELQACLAGEQPYDTEYRVIWPNGDIRWLHARGTATFDPLGVARRMVGTNWDVTDSHNLTEGLAIEKEARRQSEENYRMLLDGVQDHAIFMMDPRGQVISWNAGAERIKGFKSHQIIGQNFSCFFPPEDIEKGRPAEVLRLTTANGRHEELGMRVRKDGSRFLASVTFTALRDPAGNLRGFCEFSHDLTESKEAGAKYRGLLEAAPDAMVVVNQGGEISLLNLQAEKQFGYRRDELLGQRVTNIIPKGFAERLLADDLRSAEDARTQQIGSGIELIGRRKDGSDFPIEIMLSPLKSAEGILVTAAIRDISVRKLAEETHRQSEERFKLLVQVVADYAIYILDLNGCVTNWNLGAEHIKGYHPDEIIGQHFSRFFTAEDQERGEPQIALDTAAREGKYATECWRVRKDGSQFWGSAILHPIKGSNGTLAGFAELTRDASEERAARLALEQNREVLFQSQKMQAIGRLASGVAHDFNNILQGIIGGLELVLDEVGMDTPAQKFTEVAINAAMRGSSLTHGLLSYARKQMLRPQAILLAPFLTEIQSLLARTLGPHIGITVNVAATASVRADPGQLQTALLNLAINAAYAMPHGGALRLEALEEGAADQTWVTINVIDSGVGMDEATLARAVEPFFTTKGLDGTGLGLSMVQGFAEQSGGSIQIVSAPGNGTMVELRLPSSSTGKHPEPAARDAERIDSSEKTAAFLRKESD